VLAVDDPQALFLMSLQKKCPLRMINAAAKFLVVEVSSCEKIRYKFQELIDAVSSKLSGRILGRETPA
jgi:hypothetical protein